MYDGLVVHIVRNVVNEWPKRLPVGYGSKVFERVGRLYDIDKVTIKAQSVSSTWSGHSGTCNDSFRRISAKVSWSPI